MNKIFHKRNLYTICIAIVGLALIGLLVHLMPAGLRSGNLASLGFVSGYKEDNTPLKEVPNYEAVKQKYELKLSPDQEKYLNDNRFLLVDLKDTNLNGSSSFNFDGMLTAFDRIMGGGTVADRKPEDTKLVSPDIVLHAYHKYFELTLEELEKGDLSVSLQSFLDAMHANLSKASLANSGDLKSHYQKLDAQIVLAKVLLENKNAAKPDSFDSSEVENAYKEKDKTVDSPANAKKLLSKYSSSLTPDLVSAIQFDIDKIYAAKNYDQDPLFAGYKSDLSTDYTQFTPRSHYTKSSALRAYFRTMMYLGRSTYFAKSDNGIIDANLLTQQFTVKAANGVIPKDQWQKIMNVTGFYAGQSDDLTYTEWQNFVDEALGKNLSPANLASSANVAKQKQSFSKLRPPKILGDIITNPDVLDKTKQDLLNDVTGFRIFGQRFTFDAWILNDLTAGDEKGKIKLPSTPSALFVPAAFGDNTAKKYAGEFLKKDGFTDKEVEDFNGALDNKRSDIKKVKEDDWQSSLGTAWLHVLGSLTQSFGSGFPKYMQVQQFLDKEIETFLGSYTELKHDTLLYAKQSYAERGGGGDDETIPPVVKGFVEPNLEFWKRFDALVDHTQDVFDQNGLFQDHPARARLQNFKDIVHFYQDLANKEMHGDKISDDDYEKLRTTGLYFMAQPFDSEDASETSGRTELIADVHTDAVKEQILYEATGTPYLMLAIVGNEDSPRVVASIVYNHYEFTNPLETRLTDEDWKSWVYEQTDKLPAKNFWYQSLFVK